MTETAEWPYDADEHDPLTKLRIPVVGSAWPAWSYIVAFDCGRLDDEEFRPTGREAAMLRSFLDEYIARWCNDAWLKKRPFDIDGVANGLVFRKWGEGDWGYRRRSWPARPTYVPEHPRIRGNSQLWESPPGPLTLVKVMDLIHMHGLNEPCEWWEKWKAAHPEVFGGDDVSADLVVVSREDLRRYFDDDRSDFNASTSGLRRLWIAAGIETP